MRHRIIIALVTIIAAALCGGVTSSLADEAGIEVGIGDVRGEILAKDI